VCLAVPARIEKISGAEAEVDMGGITRKASLMLTPGAQVGDYVLLHAGFAISIVDETEAEETLRLLTEISQSMESQ